MPPGTPIEAMATDWAPLLVADLVHDNAGFAAGFDLWSSDAPWAEVSSLQRPFPDGALAIVARGVGLRKDEAA